MAIQWTKKVMPVNLYRSRKSILLLSYLLCMVLVMEAILPMESYYN